MFKISLNPSTDFSFIKPFSGDLLPMLAFSYSFFTKIIVDPGGLVVIVLSFGSEVRWFDPVRGPWIFSERKNPEYDFLRRGNKAVGPVS